MIYPTRDFVIRKRAQGFFYFCEFYTKALIALRERRNKRRKILRKLPSVKETRPPRETAQFRDRSFDYWSTPWGLLIRRLGNSNYGAGPCITSCEGQLFRRRFRVPWPVYCDLVKKCREELVFGPNSIDARFLNNRQFSLPN